jgi:Fe-S oxidoreductase
LDWILRSRQYAVEAMETRDYTEIYEGDRYCLMCRHVCPVERVTKREATSPHGWALLVASEKRGLIDWNAEAVDTLYQCADCGLCQANCATNRPLPAAIVAARAMVVERGFAPDSVAHVAESIGWRGHPYGEDFANPYAERELVQSGVGLFVGAGTIHRRPQTVEAAMKLMRAAGVEHNLLGTNVSGVYLPYTLGLWETARTLARQTIEEMERAGTEQVITLSREDAHAFRNIYPEIGVPLPDSIRVIEFVDWLRSMMELGYLQLGSVELEGYVYHDPCHTVRVSENMAVGRWIGAQMAGKALGEMFWRENCPGPCGIVGGFEFTEPWLAERLARARVEEARQAGAKGIVTEDPQCATHLAKFAEGLPVVNLVELAADNVKRET